MVQKTNPEKVVTLEIPHRMMSNSVEQPAKWRNHILFTGRAYNTEHIFLRLHRQKVWRKHSFGRERRIFY